MQKCPLTWYFNWVACEDNANQKMGYKSPRRLCMSYSSFKKAFNFCGEWTGHLKSSGRQQSKELSTLYLCWNDYLNTVFDDVVTCSLCRCCRNTALPRYPREKRQLAAILSLHVERLSFKKLIILFCRLPHEIETHLLG